MQERAQKREAEETVKLKVLLFIQKNCLLLFLLRVFPQNVSPSFLFINMLVGGFLCNGVSTAVTVVFSQRDEERAQRRAEKLEEKKRMATPATTGIHTPTHTHTNTHKYTHLQIQIRTHKNTHKDTQIHTQAAWWTMRGLCKMWMMSMVVVPG
jgi:hypothetical protein